MVPTTNAARSERAAARKFTKAKPPVLRAERPPLPEFNPNEWTFLPPGVRAKGILRLGMHDKGILHPYPCTLLTFNVPMGPMIMGVPRLCTRNQFVHGWTPPRGLDLEWLVTGIKTAA